MSLTIEDGSIVTGANSYASVADARAFALARGLTLPADDGDVEVLLIKAADYLESYESRFKGSRVQPDTQALAWPRTNVYLFGSSSMFAEDEIPQKLIDAQCQLAVTENSTPLMPTGSGREILRQKVDVIETEYAKQGSGAVIPVPTAALKLLEPLLSGGGVIARTVRV